MIKYLSIENLQSIFEKYNNLFLDNQLKLVFGPIENQQSIANESIFLTQSADPKLALDVFLKYNLKSLLQNSIQPIEEKIENTLKIYTQQFFTNEFQFLRNFDNSFLLEFNDTDQRTDLIETAFSKLNINYKNSRNHKVHLALEELLMNSQLTANTLVKNSQTNVKNNILEMQLKDQLLSISVTDFKGTLDPLIFFKKVNNTINIGVKDAINYSTRGAGVGSSFIYNACESIYIGVKPNEITKIAVIIPLNTNSITNDSLQKSIILYNPKG